MKIIGIFLLAIPIVVADDCKDIWDGSCKNAPCDGDEDQKAAACSVLAKVCCVEECDKKWDGKCKGSCGGVGNEIEIDDNICTVGTCCVEDDDTPCHELFDGTCRAAGSCPGGHKPIGNEYTGGDIDCLCPDAILNQCCGKKTDACKDLKGGNCRNTGSCKDDERPTAFGYCYNGGQDCCVPDQPCERRPTPGDETSEPMGICIEKKYCPEGYKSAEELCKPKPLGVYKWCEDSDEICCVHDRV